MYTHPWKFIAATCLLSVLVLSACGGGGSSPPPPPPPNQTPTANAGVDQTVVEGNTVTLSAAGSSDADGTLASYAWTQTDGPAVTLQGADSQTATFDPPLTDTQVSLSFELTVTDDDDATASASTTVTVEPSQPPSAQAGTDTETVERETVTLNGSGDDVDGTVASYAWAQLSGPAVSLSGGDTATPTFDAPVVSTVTSAEFELTVGDNTDDVGTDTVAVTVNPNEPPELTMHFPCADCRYYGVPISVTGSVGTGADNAFVEDLDSITALTVSTGGQSVEAGIQPDGKWVAQNVPLTVSNSEILITVSATDAFGESDDELVTLPYRPTLTSAIVAHDPVAPGQAWLYETGNSVERLFNVEFSSLTFTRIRSFVPPTGDPAQVGTMVVDQGATTVYLNEPADGVVSIDLATGGKTAVSDGANGTGPDFTSPSLMALDADDGRLVVYDDAQQALFLVDAVTGNRTIVSDNAGAGTGPAFDTPFSLAVDATNDVAWLQESPEQFMTVNLATGDRAVLAQSGDSIAGDASIGHDPNRAALAALNAASDRLYTVDTTTGERTLLSDGATMPAFAAGSARQVSVVPPQDNYVINDFAAGEVASEDSDRLLSVDPVSGERAVEFADARGAGPLVQSNASIAADPVSGSLYLASAGSAGILRVDIATGDRQTVSDSTTGSGTDFDTITDIVLDTANDRALVVDAGGNNMLIAADLTTGDRTVISGGLFGTGPAFSLPVALEPDYAGNRVFVVDQGLEAILAVDLTTGIRSTISDGSNSGPTLAETNGIALDGDGNRLLVTDTGDGSTEQTRLMAVDVASGDRTTLAGFTTGTGPFLNDLRDLVILEDGDFAVVAALTQFYRIDLSNGNRQIIAARNVGNGETMRNSSSISYDPTVDVVYTWSSSFEAVFAIDVFTGGRVMVSK